MTQGSIRDLPDWIVIREASATVSGVSTVRGVLSVCAGGEVFWMLVHAEPLGAGRPRWI
jgi:hypothetical protein